MKVRQDFVCDPTLALYLPLHHLDGASFGDRSAYGHICTVTGAYRTLPGWYFDGADDYIQCGNPTDFNATRFTILAWLKTANTGISIPVDYYYSAAGGYSLTLFSGAIRNSTRSSPTEGDDFDDDVSLADNHWHCAGISYDGAGKYIYRDGLLSKAKAFSTDPANMTALHLRIGQREELGNSYSFSGLIGEVLVFKRHLVLAEYQRYYENSQWRYR